jgi:glutamine amidotransferase
MQMMGNSSDEGKQGLRWIDASINKFDETHGIQGSHTWNDEHPVLSNPLFEGLEKGALFYFLHSI